MKKKILLSSALTIALCLGLIAGSTFALFTSSTTFSIAINSANVKLEAQIENLCLYSVVPTEGGSIVDENGGTYNYSDPLSAFSNGGTASLEGAVLTLDKITPGDKVSFKITGDNGSDVAVQYRYIIECISGYKLMSGLVVTINETSYDALGSYTSAWIDLAPTTAKINDVEISIELPVTAGNEYQNQDTRIRIVVEAVQGNADVNDDTAGVVTIAAPATAAELSNALANPEIDYIALNDDITATELIKVPATANAVLDLQGHTISATFENASASALLENKGTLVITNGTLEYVSTQPDPNFGYGTNTVNNSGVLVVDGATIINTTNGGSSNAIDNAPGASLIVESGVIKSEKIAIRLRDTSSAVINGGEISGSRAVQVHLFQNVQGATTLVVNGGTLAATVADGMALYSYAYGACTFANTTIEINGGVFNGDVLFGGGNKDATETVDINGGTFTGWLGRYLVNDGFEEIAKP